MSVVFLFLIKFSFAQKKRPDISFTIRLVGYNVGKSCKGKGDTSFCIMLILKNNSKDTVEFGHMSCSWTGLFEAMDKSFKVCGIRCGKNIPTATVLNPGKWRVMFICFYKADPNAHTLQLKFHYLDGKKYMAYQFNHMNNTNFHMPEAEYYLSNTCNAVATNRILYFPHNHLNRY